MIYMWSKEDCGYCKKACEELDKYGYDYTKFSLGSHYSKADFISRFPDGKTFPQLVDGSADEHIGGFDQLQQWIALKELNGMSL